MRRLRALLIRTAVLTMLAQSAVSACGHEVDPKLLPRPAADLGYGLLRVVSSGSNAPEMLVHLYAASRPVRNGIERVYAYQGPCQREAYARAVMRVMSDPMLHPGDLYFIVSQDRVTATHVIHYGWALRRATSHEQTQFKTCHWR